MDSVYETIDMTMQDMEDTALNYVTMMLQNQDYKNEEVDFRDTDQDLRDFEKNIGEFDKHYVARVELDQLTNKKYDL